MTGQTIPPCPVCGTVPKIDKRDNRFLLVKCCGDKKPTEWLYTQWDDHCIEELGAALQLAGITTIAQLNARLATAQPTMETMAHAFAAHPEYIAEDEGEA